MKCVDGHKHQFLSTRRLKRTRYFKKFKKMDIQSQSGFYYSDIQEIFEFSEGSQNEESGTGIIKILGGHAPPENFS